MIYNDTNPKTRKVVTDCVKCIGLGCCCLQSPQPDGSQELKPGCWAMFAVPLFILAFVAMIAALIFIIGILWGRSPRRDASPGVVGTRVDNLLQCLRWHRDVLFIPGACISVSKYRGALSINNKFIHILH